MNDMNYLPAYSALHDLPQRISLSNTLQALKKILRKLFLFSDSDGQHPYSYNAPSSQPSRMNKRRLKGFLKKSFLIPGIIITAFILFGVYAVVNMFNTSGTTVIGDEDQRVNIQKPRAQQIINKEFQFPLKDQTGKEVSQLKMHLENAELRNEIIVKGKRATAVTGRTFLIVTLKITNDFDRPVTINARDYFRLTINNSTERLAPDIHNDPVEVQAISTKYTRVGFPINDTDKNLMLQVGEISGRKETIKLNLK